MILGIARKAGYFFVILAAALFAQQKKPLTNQDIVTMVKGGFSESLIIMAIRANSCAFDTSADGLIALKNQGVTDTLIRQMLAVEAGNRNRSTIGSDQTPAASGAPTVPAFPQPGRSSVSSGSGTRTSFSSPFPTYPLDFSAERFFTQAGASPASDRKIFVHEGRLRFAPANSSVITIVDPVSRTGYQVSPGQTAEVVRRFQGVRGVVNQDGLSKFFLPVDPDSPCMFWLDVECRSMGAEQIAGRSCAKWEVSHRFAEQTWISYIWVDVKLHIVSKIQYRDFITELKDLVEGPPPVAFEVP
jgi:hypothetical protein